MSKPVRKLPDLFAVGDWSVDGDTLTAIRGATTQALEPRAYHVLRYLAERPGKLVSIDELMDAHWHGTVVTPNAVTRVIAQIRKALDDDAKRPRYIQTVARTGYRFVAPLAISVRWRNSRPRWLLAAIATIFVLAFPVWWLLPGDVDEPTVAVLPFENSTGDPLLEYLGDGVAEEIINSLAQVPQLKVTGRSWSFRFRGEDNDPGDIARQLNVAYLVEGSVRRSGQNLRFTTQLIETGSGYHVWSDTLESDCMKFSKARIESQPH